MRRVFTVGLITAFAAMGAACSSSDQPTTPSESSAAQSSWSVTGAELGQRVAAGLTAGPSSATVTFTSPSAQPLSAEMQWGDQPRFHVKLGTDDQAGTLIGVGQDVYLSKPTRPGKWMKVDLAGKDMSSGIVMDLLLGMYLQEPGAIPTLADGATVSCTAQNDAHLCQVKTTAKAYTAAAKKVLAARGIPSAMITSYFSSSRGGTFPTSDPAIIELQLDPDGRVRSGTYPVKLSEDMPHAVKVENWGATVKASVPDPKNVLTPEKFIGQ